MTVDTREPGDKEEEVLGKERWQLLHRIEDWLETPMIVLGFAWLVLLVVEFVRGLNPFLDSIGITIWVIFIIDFLLRFAIAPSKGGFFKENWLTAISLVIPALRVFRIVRVVRVLRLARATRGLRLVRVVSSLNRGMRALGNSMGRRGLGYVIVATIVVVLVGAAGMLAFEGEGVEGGALHNYGEALWWTSMLITTIASEYRPRTPEGRVLCFILSLYGIAVLGYITAALASFFIGRDAEDSQGEVAGEASIEALRAEIALLREEIRRRGS